MKICFIHTQNVGVNYYRSHIIAAALERAGHDVTWNTFQPNFLASRGRDIPEIVEWVENEGWKYDIIHMTYTTDIETIQLINLTLREVGRRKGNVPRIIMDVDDDARNLDPENINYRHFSPHSDGRKHLFVQMHTSDALTVTTPPLTQAYGDDSNLICQFPNLCHFPDWPQLTPPTCDTLEDDESIRVMYCGGRSHYGDLKMIEDVIIKLMDKHPQLRLFFTATAPEYVEPYLNDKLDPSANRAFYIQPTHNIQTYWESIVHVRPHILIAPLADTPFNDAKSHIKAFDAAMSNSIFVCSDVGAYSVVPDNTCYKCSSLLQWEETLDNLITSPKMGAQRASSLRRWVLDNNQIDCYINNVVEFYKEVLDRPPLTSPSQLPKNAQHGSSQVSSPGS